MGESLPYKQKCCFKFFFQFCNVVIHRKNQSNFGLKKDMKMKNYLGVLLCCLVICTGPLVPNIKIKSLVLKDFFKYKRVVETPENHLFFSFSVFKLSKKKLHGTPPNQIVPLDFNTTTFDFLHLPQLHAYIFTLSIFLPCLRRQN